MTNTPEFKRALSLRLSEILGEIGLNKQMVLKRRRASLLNEFIWTNAFKVLHENPNTVYRFGSQSEGTTTPGLKSDSDLLMHNDDFYVIHDWSDWKPGKVNLLIVQDNTTSPGYCLLQVLDPIEPTPISPSQLHLVPSRFLVVKGERLLLNNSYRGNKVHLYKLDNNGRRSHMVRNGR
ncbi:uncharacterized protein LOC132719966 [Ruditapes philippinarum]|uniref:uncharacterized protein LOC132719966 n=1 Tax=Ruditapes philippinarum TaxID=129788 RepID=UPI00295AB485|nr:uncharacterized protein LOC132719966 [Ruditapes philippinarum]